MPVGQLTIVWLLGKNALFYWDEEAAGCTKPDSGPADLSIFVAVFWMGLHPCNVRRNSGGRDNEVRLNTAHTQLLCFEDWFGSQSVSEGMGLWKIGAGFV